MGGGGDDDDGPKNFWGEPNDRPQKVEGPCLTRTMNAIMVGAAAGTFFGTVQIAWYPDHVSTETPTRYFSGVKEHTTDIRTVVRGMARPAFWFASAAAAFSATECIAESVRGKSDSFNSALGGMAAGAVIGSVTRRVDIMAGAAIGMGLVLFGVDFHGPMTERDPLALKEKNFGVLPQRHVESDALGKLKEKYPKFKDL